MKTISQRRQEIEEALAQLGDFKSNSAYADKRYAIDANIGFLKAARSIPKFFSWLLTVAPKLDGSQLLELTDFPIEEWDIKMHGRLIEMQKREQPGLIAPLVKSIIAHLERESREMFIADLGAGGMELDRQIIEWAVKSKHLHALTIIAIDKSPTTRRIAEENLQSLKNEIVLVEVGDVTFSEIQRMRQEAQKKILVVMCTNNIFELKKKFQPQCLDLAYHSLFRHHLTLPQQKDLDEVCNTISKRYMELDGFKSWMVVIPQIIVGWNHPHFLNGEIFSNLRFRTKKEIVSWGNTLGELSFDNISGFYLLRYH